ncbi:hypothetical protein BBJ28_00001640 [Nothophytophthora sp. Chile5]|nr:hypothetical protein BBJ28_00001640 [Nothophytophthora sp. Chile5]
MGRRFPIPREDLPKLEVSKQEHNAGKEIMTQMLTHTLHEFEKFAYDRRGVVDSKRWKSQYSHDDLSMYRERDVGATSATLAASLRHCNLNLTAFSCTAAALSPPTMMLTGWGPGRVEDAMSAVVTESQQDLALVVTYMHQDVADCAVVHTMEAPTDAAPYHYLGYKYFVKKSPTNAVVVKHRDSLYLEYCGMTQSRTGEMLGFHLMQSVELPQFPDLSGHNSVRALQSSRYLYRQKSDRIVEVFFEGNMDLSGMIVKPIASLFSAGAQFGVTRLLDLAEVRRLTDMSRNRRRYRDALRSDATEQSSTQYSTTSSYVSEDGCSVCKRGKMNKLVACHLCGQGVCQRCRSAKRVWVSDGVGILGDFRKILACSMCVMRANTGTYEPPAERVRSHRSHRSSAGVSVADGEPSTRSATGSAAARRMSSFDGLLSEEVKPIRRPATQQSPAQVRDRNAHRAGGRRRTKTPPELQTPAGPYTSPYIGGHGYRGKPTYQDIAEVDQALATQGSQLYDGSNALALRSPKATLESHSYPGRATMSVRAPGYSRSVESAPDVGDGHKNASFDGVPPEQNSMMARLMELSSMAEATSHKTQANGIYLAQQLQQQLKMQMRAGWK